mmetsp:Transcript_49436/g.112196  ORF Transcript_49436/g.112196 Transcript_49436/m.112196 type:complete len:264 (-) Transcript_49436:300-1091(-)|eukprot:CAMPEP_0172603860 /NCGR_PEP_ID=MMETSP1068-20121228/24087_1 /TAXON_ID=35684 /ORGANISM="Pseudopedinella elastica, Strain CCMP716" /LENGTH=263 /DNA_ID=CAMNT_0013405739 /DNA_START=49 /DNA_END=840 /DNA_ORIENTATION=-
MIVRAPFLLLALPGAASFLCPFVPGLVSRHAQVSLRAAESKAEPSGSIKNLARSRTQTAAQAREKRATEQTAPGRLFVGQLNKEATKELLEEAFGAIGPVAAVKIKPQVRGKQCAWVTYESPDHASEALKLDGTTIAGAKIRVEPPYNKKSPAAAAPSSKAKSVKKAEGKEAEPSGADAKGNNKNLARSRTQTATKAREKNRVAQASESAQAAKACAPKKTVKAKVPTTPAAEKSTPSPQASKGPIKEAELEKLRSLLMNIKI